MRRVFVALFLSLVFIGIGIYITTNTSPFKADAIMNLAQTDNILTNETLVKKLPEYVFNGFIWDILDGRQFIAWVSVWSLGGLSLFSFFHLLIDKLFFRKFYEQPSIFNAIRRGFLLILIFIGAVFLKLINGFVWYNIASIVLLSICLEIVYLNITKKKDIIKK